VSKITFFNFWFRQLC